ncbi:hypothetical protein EAF00_001046 [Botryotinia globosa]|nr:hypothetical protein EAF00_001046 [Botryotinia globosa]
MTAYRMGSAEVDPGDFRTNSSGPPFTPLIDLTKLTSSHLDQPSFRETFYATQRISDRPHTRSSLPPRPTEPAPTQQRVPRLPTWIRDRHKESDSSQTHHMTLSSRTPPCAQGEHQNCQRGLEGQGIPSPDKPNATRILCAKPSTAWDESEEERKDHARRDNKDTMVWVSGLSG